MAAITAPLRWLAIGLIQIYKVTLSPLIGPRCRFTPTCSTYAIEAIKTHGLAKGCWLTSKRLLKCQPLNPGGYDPVPDPKQQKSD
ncbi:membrane protein insertion efficiency factor YidD [Alginatibacterium sediminis]|uniref:Putative membrane protein insertion efficiency factor n=1 Tax=Alginatibacterium sediminis TaxID=2164068 RepID=A0A420ENH1_9ALTE|nr:membrane protein insertion efficiency factor YidD [Alginatibacterium sediminis]RKF22252.1 membrane protein insertion efficiency factor YidD [Alginatibacterium sediminis]